MPTDPNLDRLIVGLYEKTASGRVRWRISNSPNSFVTSLQSGSVYVGESADFDYFIGVADITGKNVDRRTIGDDSPSYARCSELYEAAKRSALGTDEIVRSLLEELKSL